MNNIFSTSCDPKLVRPLTDDEGKLMFQIMLADHAGSIKPAKAVDLFSSAPTPIPPILSIMLGRLKLAGDNLEYNEGMILLLTDLSGGNPGRVVMLAHALVQATRKRGSAIDVTYFAMELAPWGVPTDEVFRNEWDAQKRGGANYLDTAEAWQ